MISAARTSESRGFTLLEIVIVLSIAAVILGGSISVMVFSKDERLLRDFSGEIEVMAKRARASAILHQTPYALEFTPGFVRLMPLAEASFDSGAGLGTVAPPDPSEEVDEETAKRRKPVHEELPLPDDMALLVRRWNSDSWIPMRDHSAQVWRFDPDGLSEPVTIRLELPKSWAEDTYNPLTASIRDSQLEAR